VRGRANDDGVPLILGSFLDRRVAGRQLIALCDLRPPGVVVLTKDHFAVDDLLKAAEMPLPDRTTANDEHLHSAVHPPSTTRLVPFTYLDASEARNTTAP